MRNSLAEFVFTALPAMDRYKFGLLTISRIVIVGLDVIGLLLISSWASLSSGNQLPSTFQDNIDHLESLVGIQAEVSLGLGALIVFVIKGILAILLNARTAKFVARIEAQKSSSYFSNYLKSDLGVVEKFPKGRLSHALVDSTSSAFGLSLIAFSLIVGEAALIVAVSVFLALENISLFIVIGVLFSLLAFSMRLLIGNRISESAKLNEEKLKDIKALISDVQLNFRQISISKRVADFSDYFYRLRKSMSDSTSLIAVYTALPRYVIEFGLIIGLAFILMPTPLRSELDLNQETIAVFTAGVFRLVASVLPFQNQSSLIRKIKEDSFEAMKMEQLLNPAPEIIQNSSSDSLGSELQPDLHLKNISFTFPEDASAILDNLNMTIPFGSLVVVEGESGSGKSTFVDLLLGLRTPSAGSIMLTSNKKEISFDQHLFSYVPQKPELIGGTVLQNLLMSPTDSNPPTDEVSRVIEAVNLGSLISSLPDGLQTPVTRHSQFSGGQIQRIGIARALLSKPKILIIDEGTSALDAKNTEIINQTIAKLRGRVTLIVISHDADDFANADFKISFSITNSTVDIRRASF